MPGHWHFSLTPVRMRTLLGSCVGVTLWHPQRRIGGMCHYLLPTRRSVGHGMPDGRYGDEAIALLVERLERAGTKTSEYVAHLYGGADTMPDQVGVKLNVGERNIELGFTLLDQHGFQIENVDVGETVPRTVSLDVATGEVTMRRGAPR